MTSLSDDIDRSDVRIARRLFIEEGEGRRSRDVAAITDYTHGEAACKTEYYDREISS